MSEIRNCEYYGYRVGDKFSIVRKESVGSDIANCNVLTLSQDDGSDSPKFDGDNGNWGYATLCALEKITEAPQWNGEGLPPVGTVCRLSEETEFLSLHTGLITIKPTGTKVQVIGHATRIDNGCACVVIQPVDDMDCGFSVGNHEMMIKPLITKRDEWIDKAHKTGCPINIAALIYDAGLAKDIEE